MAIVATKPREGHPLKEGLRQS